MALLLEQLTGVLQIHFKCRLCSFSAYQVETSGPTPDRPSPYLGGVNMVKDAWPARRRDTLPINPEGLSVASVINADRGTLIERMAFLKAFAQPEVKPESRGIFMKKSLEAAARARTEIRIKIKPGKRGLSIPTSTSSTRRG